MISLQSQIQKSEEEIKKAISDCHLRAKREVYFLFNDIKLGTLWYREVVTKDGRRVWEFNHLEDGHCPNNTPTPLHNNHKMSWAQGKWAKVHIQLHGKQNKVNHFLVSN